MTARRIVSVVALLGLVSTETLAQRGGGMGGMGRMGRGGGAGNVTRQPGIVIPKYVNAVNLLVERRQDLLLSDTQFVRVVAIKRTLDSTNMPLLRKLDSVQRLFKGGAPMFSDQSPERRDSLATARELIQETVGGVRDNISVSRDRAYALLSSQQRAKAQEFENKAEKTIADEVEQAARGRSGRGGGTGPPAN